MDQVFNANNDRYSDAPLAVDYEALKELSRVSEQRKRFAYFGLLILYAPIMEYVGRALGVAAMYFAWGLVDEVTLIYLLTFGVSFGALITFPLVSLILSLTLTFNRVGESIRNFFRARYVVWVYDAFLALHALLFLALAISRNPALAGLMAAAGTWLQILVLSFVVPLITIAMAIGERAESKEGITTAFVSGLFGTFWSTFIQYLVLKHMMREISSWWSSAPQQSMWSITEFLNFNPLAAVFTLLVYAGAIATIIWARLRDVLAETPIPSSPEEGY